MGFGGGSGGDGGGWGVGMEHTIKIKIGCFYHNNLGPKRREAISSIILQSLQSWFGQYCDNGILEFSKAIVIVSSFMENQLSTTKNIGFS